MISIQYPSIREAIYSFGYGLLPIFLVAEDQFSLIVKAPKEAILAARVNQEISFYFVPDISLESRLIGVITAFFDDNDEPLVLYTPLYADDELQIDLLKALRQEAIEIYFFDENSRELMGVRASLEGSGRVASKIKEADFNCFDPCKVGDTTNLMSAWFGRRVANDDKNAIRAKFVTTLYPDDLLILDISREASVFHGATENSAFTSLEREEPGALQERDIAGLLRRAFLSESIFLNPSRQDADTEFADIVCIDDDFVLVIQAKDSPNTEASLRRGIDRKRAVIRSHIDKAAKQLTGAFSNVKQQGGLNLNTTGGDVSLNINGRTACGLVVVRELFDDDYKACSEPVLATARRCKVPCVLMDFASLHMLTMHSRSSARLMGRLLELFELALQHNEYPKLRFIGNKSA